MHSVCVFTTNVADKHALLVWLLRRRKSFWLLSHRPEVVWALIVTLLQSIVGQNTTISSVSTEVLLLVLFVSILVFLQCCIPPLPQPHQFSLLLICLFLITPLGSIFFLISSQRSFGFQYWVVFGALRYALFRLLAVDIVYFSLGGWLIQIFLCFFHPIDLTSRLFLLERFIDNLRLFLRLLLLILLDLCFLLRLGLITAHFLVFLLWAHSFIEKYQ